MSDTILTAEQLMDRLEHMTARLTNSADWHELRADVVRLGAEKEALRQQVATLTAENEAMSLDYARLLEQMTSELRESKAELDALREERDNLDREQKFQHARADKWVEVIKARDAELETVKAERDALREELAKEKYLHKKALDLGVVFQNAIDDKVDRLERELAEARVEIARLTDVLQERYDVVERAAHAAGVQQGREQLEMKYRQLLWLNHGHPIHALYGDDGEMQCAACAPFGAWDYLRTDMAKLEDVVFAVKCSLTALPAPPAPPAETKP